MKLWRDRIALQYGFHAHTRIVYDAPNGEKYVRCHGSIFLVKDDHTLTELDGSARAYGRKWFPMGRILNWRFWR